MISQRALSDAFNVRPGEGRIVFLFIVHSFFIGFAKLFADTAALTLFLVRYDASDLPYMYILSTVVIFSIGIVYSQIEKRIRFFWLLVLNLLLTLSGLLFFRYAFSATDARWPALALAVGAETMWVLTSLEFWGLAGRIFNVRQAKRLFGLIGSGEVLASILGGLSVSLFLELIHTPDLLFLSITGIGCSFVMMIYITRVAVEPLRQAERSQQLATAERSVRALFKSRYIVLIFLVAALAVSSLYFVDNAFSSQAEIHYPTADALAGFLGTFYAIAGVTQFFSRAFLSGFLIGRYGVVVGLLALPVMLAVGAVAVVATAEIFGPVPAIFGLVVLVKLIDKALRYTVNQSAVLVLYQPLPAERRTAVQTVSESIVEAFAGIVVGVVLLVMNTVWGFGAVQLLFALLFVLAGWLVVVVFLNREYARVLIKALANRRLGRVALTLDGSSVAILTQSLRSSHASEVIYALDTLEVAEHTTFDTFLVDLLVHPAPEVRLNVLQKIEEHNLISALPIVRERLWQEQSPRVRGRLLRTLTTLGETEVLDDVLPFLEDDEPDVRTGAMVGLLRSGGIEGVLAAGERIIGMENSADPVEREFAATVLGEVGIRSYYRPLLELLRDPEARVRRAALAAAGKVQNIRLWPSVIESLAAPDVGSAAVAALAFAGEEVVPELNQAFEEPDQSQAARVRILRVCARIRGPAVIDMLRDRIGYDDEHVRNYILQALQACGYQAEDQDISRVHEQIRAELSEAAWTLKTIIELQADARMKLVVDALHNEIRLSRRRILLLLSFLYDPESIARVQDSLFHASQARHAYALEILDVVLAPDLKGVVLPLLDDTSAREQSERLSEQFPQEDLGADTRFRQILSDEYGHGHLWTKVCALYVVPSLEGVRYSDAVVDVLKKNLADPVIQETALWTLHQIAPGLYRLFVQQVQGRQPSETLTGARDLSDTVGSTITQLERQIRGGRQLLLTVEMVIILKTVSIFSETPEDLLAEIASILEEVEVPAGETIITKGDVGDCMYIIAGGEVRVHDGDRTIVHLGEREVVGDLALLDSEPRTAAVSAVKDTLLLKLSQDAFYELLADHPEVARGILRVLAQRLRAADRALLSQPTQD